MWGASGIEGSGVYTGHADGVGCRCFSCGANRPYTDRIQELAMDISRRLAILIFCGVPAIVGGGIIYGATDSMTAMWIYEVLLLITAGALISR